MAVLGETGRKVIERVLGKGWLGGQKRRRKQGGGVGGSGRCLLKITEGSGKDRGRMRERNSAQVRARKDERVRKSALEVMDKSWKRRAVMGKKMAFVPRV
jgi:hypothetical protein